MSGNKAPHFSRDAACHLKYRPRFFSSPACAVALWIAPTLLAGAVEKPEGEVFTNVDGQAHRFPGRDE